MDFTEAVFCEVFQKIDTPLSQIYWRPPVYEFIPLIEKYRMITFLFGKSSSLEIFCWRFSALISASPWGGDFLFPINLAISVASGVSTTSKSGRMWNTIGINFNIYWILCSIDFIV